MIAEVQEREAKICWLPEGGKLVFLREQATPEFWDRHWRTTDWTREVTRSRSSRYWRGILKKYLPDTRSRILEGGCGYGHIVDAMDHWGYRAVGVDFAPETVARIKQTRPTLDVRCGDVRALDFEDESFDGYWSLGVIEHFWDGYEAILREMGRVLKPGGYAFVSFPCISRMDRVKIFMAGYETCNPQEKPESFYQFALDVRAVRGDLERLGFKCVRTLRKNGWFGLTRVWPAFRPVCDFMTRLSEKGRCAKLLFIGTDLLVSPLCGHSVLLVLRKR